MSNNQDIPIVTEVLSGNHEEYRYLVERYHRGLIQHLYNLIGNKDTAEDVAQEAFIRAYDKLSQYNSDFAFSTWLYKIADNIAFRNMKQAKNNSDISEVEDLIPDDKPTFAENLDKSFTGESVRKAVNTLPVGYRQVISLYYWDGFTYEEIAEVMNRPVGTVRTWLHRAKEELRKELYGQV